MGITYTISKKRSQVVHGVRDWNQMFRMEPNNDTTQLAVIRARKDRKIVGQAVVTDDWIVFLAVDPKCRGNGIGTKLVSEAEKEIFNNGYEEVKLHPQKEFQDRLVPWYESLGYEIVGFDSKCQEYNMVKINPEIYKQHPLDESKDYKYKAKVGDFWLQKDVNKEWSVCDDEAEADEFESETEPTQIINQMKKDGKVKKDTKYKIVKIKENRNMAKKLREGEAIPEHSNNILEPFYNYENEDGAPRVVFNYDPYSNTMFVYEKDTDGFFESSPEDEGIDPEELIKLMSDVWVLAGEMMMESAEDFKEGYIEADDPNLIEVRTLPPEFVRVPGRRRESMSRMKDKKPLKESKEFVDVVEGDTGRDYNGESVVVLDKGAASDFEWAQGYDVLEDLTPEDQDIDEAFPECVLVEQDGEQILYSYGGDGVLVEDDSDSTRVRQISFDFIDNGNLSAEDIISRIQDAMSVAGIEIVGGPNFGDTSWTKEEYGIKD